MSEEPSTGHRFNSQLGLPDYVGRYFAGYQSDRRLLSIDTLADDRTRVRADFTGDFGQEIGLLDLKVDANRPNIHVHTDLE